MYEDQINLSSKAAEGMERSLGQDFNRVEMPERMAWIVLLLKRIEDTEEFFPMGKWATIQSIESQLEAAANKALEMDGQKDARHSA